MAVKMERVMVELQSNQSRTVKPLFLAALNFGVYVHWIILAALILAFFTVCVNRLLLKYIFAARYFREFVRVAKFAK